MTKRLTWRRKAIKALVVSAGWLVIALAPATAQASAPVLAVDAPAILKRLESKGLDFGTILGGPKAQGLTNHALLKYPRYRSLARSLTRDLKRRKAGETNLSVTMATGKRLFDSRWLHTKAAHFELVGVINRMDRAPFKKRTCGELRLIYRLAYRKPWKGSEVYSRLPMTVNVVFWQLPRRGQSCQAIAERWRPSVGGAPLAEFLTSPKGPLRPRHLRVQKLKSVEVNLQSVRWPSTMRPDMAGYAEYLMRVFVPKGKKLVLGHLENTPDVKKISRSKRLKRRLLKWLKKPATQARLEAGTAVIPKKYLAKRATSFALHGLSRKANRPFDALFKPDDFKGVKTEGNRVVRSPHSLLRRLNDMSCVGCHQNRTIAGFHFVGKDRAETHAVNAVHTSGSSHFVRDQMRRKRFLKALLAGRTPTGHRPFSDRADHHEGDYGSHCGVPDSADYGHWECDPGLSCQVVDAPQAAQIGECLPTHSRRAGDPCEVGTVTQRVSPFADRIVKRKNLSCSPGYYCETSRVGFPGGMCSDGCQSLQSGETCGSIAVLFGFNRCLARGKKPFFECLSENVRPGSLRRCDAQSPCRDDYICTRLKDGTGGCIPPYFLFQLRLDGHPHPLK